MARFHVLQDGLNSKGCLKCDTCQESPVTPKPGAVVMDRFLHLPAQCRPTRGPTVHGEDPAFAPWALTHGCLHSAQQQWGDVHWL